MPDINEIEFQTSYFDEQARAWAAQLEQYLMLKVTQGEMTKAQANSIADDFIYKFNNGALLGKFLDAMNSNIGGVGLDTIFRSTINKANIGGISVDNDKGIYDYIILGNQAYQFGQQQSAQEQAMAEQQTAVERQRLYKALETESLTQQQKVKAQAAQQLADSIYSNGLAQQAQQYGMNVTYWHDLIANQPVAYFDETSGEPVSNAYQDFRRELNNARQVANTNQGRQYAYWLPQAYSQYTSANPAPSPVFGGVNIGGKTVDTGGRTASDLEAAGFGGVSDVFYEQPYNPESDFYNYVNHNEGLKQQATNAQAEFLRKYPNLGTSFLEAQKAGAATGDFMSYVGSSPDLLAAYQTKEKERSNYESWGQAAKSPKTRFLYNR